jgi:hypothetical protein
MMARSIGNITVCSQKNDQSSAYPRFSAWFTVLYKGMYTNLVVIVNKTKFVDKSFTCFVNSGLRREKVAGQGLYSYGMAVGQKSACGQRPWFCTSHPVDIQ